MTGTVAADGDTAFVMDEFNPENEEIFGGRYVIKDNGVFYVGSANGGDDLGFGTYKVASLPLRVGESFTQIDRAGIDFGEDWDGDGRHETLSVSSVVKVIGLENVTVPAGNFEDCALLQTDITEILTLSANGDRFVVSGSLKEWYAQEVGVVKRLYQMSQDGYSETEEYTLESYFVDGRGSEQTAPTAVAAQPAGTIGGGTSPISVQFSEDMDPTTFTTSTFTLADAQGQQVTGQISYAGRSATFFSATPLGSGTYRATISTGAQDLAGNGLGAEYSWSFNLDSTAPQVIDTFPVDQAERVDRTVVLTATFSEEMNPASLSYGSFLLKDPSGNWISGNVSVSGRTVTFTPNSPLERGVAYTATLVQAVQDAYGNSMTADYSWSFTVDPGLFLPYAAIPTGSWPEAVAIGDVNGDGRNDVVMTTSFYFDAENDYKLLVLLQGADGTLEPAVKHPTSGTYTASPDTVAIGDLNNDGRNDILVGNSGLGIEVFLQDAAGNLTPGVSYATVDSNKVRIADLNGDGLQDVVGIGSGTDTVSVLYQNLDGTLETPVVSSVTHGGFDDLEVGDVNDDGRPDVIVMSGQLWLPNLGILLQDQAGGLSVPAYYSIADQVLTHGVGIGDVNGDGRADVVVSSDGNRPSSAIGVFLQNASGLLDPAISYVSYDIPEPVEVADVNSDGRQDIVVLHGGWNSLGVYLQGADGELQTEGLYQIPYATHYNPHGMAVGDINGDGWNDAVIADYNNGLVVLYNTAQAVVMPNPIGVSPLKADRSAPSAPRFKGIRLR